MADLKVRVMWEHVQLAKLVSFNWYVFGVIVWTKGTPRPSRRRAVERMEQWNGMVDLARERRIVVVQRPFMNARTWAMIVMRGGGEMSGEMSGMGNRAGRRRSPRRAKRRS
jgi:hypothetical protein